jgi:ribosomal protein S18 acetylase RimI-like enzyme
MPRRREPLASCCDRRTRSALDVSSSTLAACRTDVGTSQATARGGSSNLRRCDQGGDARDQDPALGSRPAHMGALLAVRPGAIVGLVEWEIGVDDDPSVGEIHAIHVALEERGRGVGWRLLDAAVDALRDQGVRRAILWVVEDNVTARAFYERQGWAWDGTRLERPLGGFPGFPTVVEVRYGSGRQPRVIAATASRRVTRAAARVTAGGACRTRPARPAATSRPGSAPCTSSRLPGSPSSDQPSRTGGPW